MAAVTVEGTRNEARTFNDQPITGCVDFANGTVHLSGR